MLLASTRLVTSRRVARIDRRMRPQLQGFSAALLEDRALTSAGFRGIGNIGNSDAQALSRVVSYNGLGTQEVRSIVPGASGGAGASSSHSNTVTALQMPPDESGPGAVIPIVIAGEQGIGAFTITANSAGSSLAKIELHGSHLHTDSLTVTAGPTLVAGGFVPGPIVQQTQGRSSVGSPYTWEIADDNGQFDPSWTFDVEFSVSLSAPQANFIRNGNLVIATNLFTATVGAGNAIAGPVIPGGIRIVDNTTNLSLIGNATFAGGSATFSFSMPATPQLTMAYNSAFVSGPSGTFGAGNFGAVQGFTYDLAISLNT